MVINVNFGSLSSVLFWLGNRIWTTLKHRVARPKIVNIGSVRTYDYFYFFNIVAGLGRYYALFCDSGESSVLRGPKLHNRAQLLEIADDNLVHNVHAGPELLLSYWDV